MAFNDIWKFLAKIKIADHFNSADLSDKKEHGGGEKVDNKSLLSSAGRATDL